MTGSAPGDNRTEHWDKVDRAVKAFEDAWRFGKQPVIEDYLHHAGEERLALLRELALVDLERRLKAGQPARVEAYLQRFAELADEPQGVLDLIFLEYEQRRRKEPIQELRAEILGRFPAHRQALLSALDRLQAEEESFTEIGEVPALAAQARTATDVSQTLAELVTLLREGQFLKQVHLDKVTRDLQHRFGQIDKLLRELVRWGWLTPYQAGVIAQGSGPGLLVGPYVLLEPLGAGGMGQVFKARHHLMNRLAAVKLIRPEARSSPDFLQRFLREVEAAAQLAHPNIVAAFDAARTRADTSRYQDGQLWIWDLKRQKAREPIHKKTEHKSHITSMALSPDGHSLFTCAPVEGKVIHWAVPAGDKKREWRLPNTSYYFQVLAVAPDSRYLAVGWADGRILILRLKETEK